MYPWLPWCVYYTEESGKLVLMFWSFYCMPLLCLYSCSNCTKRREVYFWRTTRWQILSLVLWSLWSPTKPHSVHESWLSLLELGPQPLSKNLASNYPSRWAIWYCIIDSSSVSYTAYCISGHIQSTIQGYKGDSKHAWKLSHYYRYCCVPVAAIHTVALLILR